MHAIARLTGCQIFLTLIPSRASDSSGHSHSFHTSHLRSVVDTGPCQLTNTHSLFVYALCSDVTLKPQSGDFASLRLSVFKRAKLGILQRRIHFSAYLPHLIPSQLPIARVSRHRLASHLRSVVGTGPCQFDALSACSRIRSALM